MGTSNRDTARPDPAVTPNSAAFQAWLRQRQADSAAADAPAPSSSPAHLTSGRQGSGSGSGSGSGGSGSGGYGLALICADDAARERIQAIMRDICAREQRKQG